MTDLTTETDAPVAQKGPAPGSRGRIGLLYDSPVSFSGQYAATELIRRTLGPLGWSFVAFEFPALNRAKSPLLRYGSYLLGTVRSWIKLLRESPGEGQVVHINLPQSLVAFTRMGPAVLLLDRLRPDVRKVVSLNGSVFMSWDPQQREARAFLRILKAAAVVTVVGPVQRQRLIDWGLDPERVRVLENPSEFEPLDLERLVEKQTLGGEDDPVTVLHLSLLIESKGFPEYLEALELLSRRDLPRPIRAVLCGPMSFTSFCTRLTTEADKEAWIEARVEAINRSESVSVEWVRGARGAEKQALFEEAQVFVFPSQFPVEAQPLVLLEAMASGCAVVSSQVGEIPSTLPQDGALLLDTCTPEEVADRIEALTADPALRLALARSGLDAVTTRFSPARYQQKWDGLIRELTSDTEPMTPTHILVTGSDGFIGQWLCDLLLAEGHTVAAVDKRGLTESREGYRKHVCNILDADRLRAVFEEERPDAVVHLAARTDLDETCGLAGYADNIEGVRNVCDAVKATDSVRRAIYTSSQLVCEIGYRPTADDDYRPSTTYGRSKVRTEQIVREEDGGGCEWCLARPTTVWGPGMNPHYQSMLRYIRQGRYFHVGRAPLYKSYSYVGNIAHQYRQMLLVPVEAIHGRTFYLADYEPLSLRAYTNGLQAALGARRIPSMPLPVAKALAKTGDALTALGLRSFPFTTFRLTNILAEYVLDLSPTEEVCGPLPYGFEEGVRATAEWFQGLDETPTDG